MNGSATPGNGQDMSTSLLWPLPVPRMGGTSPAPMLSRLGGILTYVYAAGPSVLCRKKKPKLAGQANFCNQTSNGSWVAFQAVFCIDGCTTSKQ